MLDSQTGWAVTDGPSILRTVDGGRNWKDVAPQDLVPEDWDEGASLTTYFLDANTGWATAQTGIDSSKVVWRTLDGGQTWAPGQPIVVDDLFAGLNTGDSGYQLLTGDRYIPQTLQFLDANAGWLALSAGYFYNHIFGAIAILRTTDGGASWEFVSVQGVCAYGDLVFENSQMGWLVDHGRCVSTLTDEVLRSRNGGLDWEPISLPPPTTIPDSYAYQLSAPELVSGSLALHLTENGGEFAYWYRTNDGGQTWRVEQMPWGSATRPYFFNERVGWLVGLQMRTFEDVLYHTQDSGHSWQEIAGTEWLQSLPVSARFSFVTEKEGWVLVRYQGPEFARGGQLWHTTDGGFTWEHLQLQLVP
jgi:photosystem II stability/assembly factor-like uncharacterized protein